ncbi:hypothetical protein TWF481_010307 [Arthrobotrys musiformis]|uniref:lytic cellulose monooxygenase (C4-dehydrogenating) n=1 Tax=Arthrobotrys musiformis TaxID=47236 RepID=A0AAV9W2A4_9PEZI
MKLASLVALLLSAATTVSAHAYIKEFIIDGQSYPGFDPFEPPQPGIVDQYWDTNFRNKKNTDAYVPPGSGDEIVCRKNAQPVPTVAMARAGAYITFRWTRWQTNHIGPILTYLADCNGNCAMAIGSQLSWFKIDEAGYNGRLWATEVLQKQGKTYTIQLPKTLKDGQYLLRHEMVAFKNSFKDQALPVTQLYPTCANIQIINGSGQVTPQAVPLQGYYQEGAPGLPVVDIQRGLKYPFPGPPLTPGLGNTPSEQLNPGVNKNPAYDPFQEKLNEPTDDNGTVPNFHLDWFARNGVAPPNIQPNQKRSNNQSSGVQNLDHEPSSGRLTQSRHVQNEQRRSYSQDPHRSPGGHRFRRRWSQTR